MFAVVRAGGTLARGTPGTVVSHHARGRYKVTFPASVKGCAAIANLGYAGTRERFTFPAAVTASAGPHTSVFVDVTFPGPTTPGEYPDAPVLRNNSFHLHVDCGHALIARVAANGTLVNASPEVSIRPHVRRSGQYVLDFGSDISACAPVGTARNPKPRAALARQVYLALGGDSRSLRVSVNDGTTRAVDHAFSLIVTCDESPKAVYPSSDGFFNLTTIPGVADCALTATWFEPEPGATPSNQGYVSTWARSRNTAVVQTKNGGYGVATGFGVDLVATCPSS